MIHISDFILSFNEEILLEVKNLNINKNKIIALIGNNGSGKTSFAKTLMKLNNNYSGTVNNTYSSHYLNQSYFKEIESLYKSGGEIAKLKIIDAFSGDYQLLILDEPSVHLDSNNIKFLIDKIKRYKGLIILISNDRFLIEKTAEEIYEIEDCKLNIFKMDYKKYLIEKQNKENINKAEYIKYISNKNKIEKAINNRNTHHENVKRQPKRMGISDARLGKWTKQGNPSINRNKKALKNKLEKLEVKNIQHTLNKEISFSYLPSRKSNLFFIEKYNLSVKNNSKIGILGNNGSGKTTLLESIFNKYKNIYKIGYLSQSIDNVFKNYTVKQYIDLHIPDIQINIRKYLSQFKYRENTYHKKIIQLSEGEKVQLNISILLSQK